MAEKSILVIEDETAVARLLNYNLTKAGYKVTLAMDGLEGIELARQIMPNLILLDWMMPKLSGPEVAKILRNDQAFIHIPIIMLTARGTEGDKLEGFRTGLDDYMVKPFSLPELLARIEVRLRTQNFMQGNDDSSKNKLEYGGLILDSSNHRVSFYEQSVKLSPKEFQLLKYLIARPSHVFTREQILDAVWGFDVHVEVRTVDVHIRRLRKSLIHALKDQSLEIQTKAANLIRTVHGSGYALEHL